MVAQPSTDEPIEREQLTLQGRLDVAERALQARQHEIDALHRITALVLREQPLREVLQAVAQEVSACTDFPIVAIELYDAVRQVMEFAAATGIPVPDDSVVLRVPVEQTLSGLVARTGQALIESNAQNRPEYADTALRQLGVRTFICVPLAVTEQVIGTLSLAHPEAVPLDDHFIPLAHSLANVIATLIARRQAEERTMASERQLRAILDKLAAGVLLMDTEGRYLFANQRAAAMLGRTPDDVIGASLSDFLPPDVAQHYLARNRQFIAAGDFAEYEATFDLPVGTRTFFIADQVLTNEQGVGQTLLTSSIDITARVQAETALRLSEERFAKAFHGNPTAMSISRQDDGTIVAVNRSFLDLYGYTEAEVLGRTTIDLHIFISLDDRRDIVAHLLAQTSGATYEMTTRTKAGAERIVLLAVERITIDGVAHLLSARHDITARVQAEQALRESERKLRTLIDLLPVGISVLDAERRVIFMNPALEQILDLSHAALLHGAYRTRHYLRPDGTAMPAEEFASARAIHEQRAVTHVETGIVTETGRVIWTAVSAVPVVFSDWSVVIVTADITALKQSEAALRASQQNLETLIENTDGSIWSVDCDYRLIVSNRLFQRNTSEALGRPLAAGESVLLPAWPPAAQEEWRSYYDRAMRQGPFSIETTTRFTDAPHTVEYRFSPIITAPEQVTGVTVFGRDITARKQAETALQVALTKYRTLFDSFPLGITVANATGQIVESNAMAESLLGLGADEHRQRTIDGAEWQIIRSDGSPMSPAEYASVRALTEQRVIENVEMGIITPSGATTWINVTAAPLPLDGYGVVITYSDITARKHTEAALRESEAKFRTLAASLPQLIWTTLPDGQITYLSAQWAIYTGIPHAQLLERSWEQAIYPDDLPGIVDRWRQSVQMGAPLEIKARYRHHSGIWRWQLVRGVPITGQGGQISEWVGTCTDIHESEAGERNAQLLLDLEQRTNHLEDPAQIEQIVVDQLGTALDLTRCYFGHIAGEQVEVRHEWRRAGLSVIGSYRLHDYVTPAAIDQFRQNIPTMVTDVATDPRTIAAATNYQALEIGAFITTPMVYQETWVGALNIVSPVARVWQLEELQLLREVIARVWPQLERARVQAALRQTLDDLTRSNAELEQFAYVASHDLQEPLRAVTGMVQLLQQRYQGQLDARADQYIGLAVEAATRMQTLINDLLTFSRVQRRGQSLRPTPLETVLTTAQTNLQVAIAESGAVITHDDLPMVLGDATQLTQLFQNLLANAIKFHGIEPPRIHISVARRDQAWCFAVRDNGIGIAPDYFERIFVIFQRLHSRQAYPGTGIGLALCKKIVERHGGQIWVESRLGDGATFCFTLPDRS